jgi:ribosome recycling factor
MKTFSQVVESADDLAPEEQESLIGVLQRRLTQRRRAELVKAVKEARREFKAGCCRPATPAQILKRVLP